MSKFYEYIYAEQQTICEKLGIQKDMIPLTEREKIDYENATVCSNCKNHYDGNSRIKVRHHCQLSRCSLQQMQFAVEIQEEKVSRNERRQIFIPVIAHNMKGYDSHLITKHYERHASLDFPINVIPTNTEKFVAFQIGKLRFLDSLQSQQSSVEL